ncbi:hypothetical protein THAOC_06889 [Thalassiosira oceanica]|uniref:Uncharacterized protein n=1 Tax=Thalassiosira oceanica TaxID=159749 RepID=K0SZ56_THAOC|nr:hypothetical protein THAOC_06889 [Thalassiosira oceanica]|eukprot:EJK71648.1 hypothetical protein THAOC_06889 [Thalassiosira oceanica]
MEADESITSLVDEEPSCMVEPTRAAGPTVSSSVMASIPAAGPTVPVPTADPTPDAEPVAPSSLTEPLPLPTEPVARPEDVATMPVEGPACAPEGGNNSSCARGR